MSESYKEKYLKYKNKYLNLKNRKNITGGTLEYLKRNIEYNDLFGSIEEKNNINNDPYCQEILKLFKDKKENIIKIDSIIDDKIKNLNNPDKQLGGGKKGQLWLNIINNVLFPNKHGIIPDKTNTSIIMSEMSDPFIDDPNARYAGIICWCNNLEESIDNMNETNRILDPYTENRGIYILIQDTAKWDESSFGTGVGQVHGFLHSQFKKYMREYENHEIVCLSGFSIFLKTENDVRKWCIKYSSRSLNEEETQPNNLNKSMIYGEIFISNMLTYSWMHNGFNPGTSGSNIKYNPVYSSIIQSGEDSWTTIDLTGINVITNEGHHNIIDSSFKITKVLTSLDESGNKLTLDNVFNSEQKMFILQLPTSKQKLFLTNFETKLKLLSYFPINDRLYYALKLIHSEIPPTLKPSGYLPKLELLQQFLTQEQFDAINIQPSSLHINETLQYLNLR